MAVVAWLYECVKTTDWYTLKKILWFMNYIFILKKFYLKETQWVDMIFSGSNFSSIVKSSQKEWNPP